MDYTANLNYNLKGTASHAASPDTNPAIHVTGAARGELFKEFLDEQLLNERIVMLDSDVNAKVASHIIKQLLYLEGIDQERDIWLYINSPGGSVTAGMAIYDTMQFVSPAVGTICMGLGASMGQFLLCAGEPGKRYALPHARILMHQPSGGVEGQATDIQIQAEEFSKNKQKLTELLSQHTGQSVEQILKDSDRDRWFSATEAKDYGMLDKVIVRRGEML